MGRFSDVARYDLSVTFRMVCYVPKFETRFLFPARFFLSTLFVAYFLSANIANPAKFPQDRDSTALSSPVTHPHARPSI